MANERQSAGRRWLWFIGLWLAGVAGLGLVALVIRFVLSAAGLRT